MSMPGTSGKCSNDDLKLPINPTLRTALEQIKPSLDTYINAGERIVGLALDNPDAARRNWAPSTPPSASWKSRWLR